MCLLIIAVTPFIIFVLFRENPDVRVCLLCNILDDTAIKSNVDHYENGFFRFIRGKGLFKKN